MNPYDVLGVPPTASAAQIKTAYRRRAMETHPDRGNDGAEFAIVARAYAVLTDAEMRKRFDETGTIDELPLATLHQRMVSIVANILGQALDETVKASRDPKTINYVEHMRQNVRINIEGLRRSIATHRKVVADSQVLLKRITRKGDGENVFVEVLKARIAQFEKPLRDNALTLAAFERLADELQHYTNEVEVMQAFTVMQYGAGSFSQAPDRNAVMPWWGNSSA